MFCNLNSKTIHANTGISNSNSHNLDRLTVYITLLPRSLSSEENRQKKTEAYLNGDTCSRQANKCVIKRYHLDLRNNI